MPRSALLKSYLKSALTRAHCRGMYIARAEEHGVGWRLARRQAAQEKSTQEGRREERRRANAHERRAHAAHDKENTTAAPRPTIKGRA